jgi:two-component system, NarL family, invasion response regulator UvrY
MIRILIADDHAIVHRGLKQIVADEPDMVVAGEATTGHEALMLIRQQPWDVVVLDLSMPGRGGLDVLKELSQERRRVPVLVLSMHPEEQFAVRALRLGAAGYLTKESAPEELVKAIRKAVAGGRYVSAALAEKLAGHLGGERGDERPPHEMLSDREYLVLRLIASGKSVSTIADELALSVKTVSTYRTRILEKMRMQNNAELTHYAISNRLVELSPQEPPGLLAR